MRFNYCLLAIVASSLLAFQSKAENADLAPGLVGEYYAGGGGAFTEVKPGDKPTYVRVDKQVNFGNMEGDFYGVRLASDFHVRWTGLVRIEKDGKYEFATESDDGSRLSIDGKVVVNNGGVHPVEHKAGKIDLKAGDHKLLVEFFQGGGGAACVVGWTVPGGKPETIPAKFLFHAKDAEKIDYDKTAWEKRPKGTDKIEGNAQIGKGGGGGGGPGNPVHEKMDYGPFLSGTIESSYPAGGNYALKGLSMRLGSKKQASVSFDTEMLRYSVGWTGEWLKLDYGRDGLEGHPTLRGTPKFGTKGSSIGWANQDGAFTVKVKDKKGEEKLDDPRERSTAHNLPEGPLPKEWGRYKGIYVDGLKSILHYTVGDADVLEQPTFDDSDGIDVFARTFEMKNVTKALKMVVIEDGAATGAKAAPKTGVLELKDNQIIVAGLSGMPDGVKFSVDESAKDKRILLEIAPQAVPLKFTLKIANLKDSDKSKFETALEKKVDSSDFDAVTKKGGAPRWKPIVVSGETAEGKAIKDAKRPAANKLIDEAKKKLNAGEKLTPEAEDALYAQVKLSPEDEAKALSGIGAYVVDTITVPFENEYGAYMRITGIDFFKDGRAAVCTMSGDVWVLSGIDKDLKKVTWQRFATGLFASLGLKIVDDQIYTLGRDQITRFTDLNNDGEADYYECFNNDCTVGPDYHEFAHDLHTDTKGDFYYMKGSNLSAAGAKYHGTMVKVAKDGSSSEVYAVGFRAPNGMCVGPHDEITTGDNQGDWTPSSPVNWIKKGGFYGHREDYYPQTKVGPRQNPLCWIPYNSKDGNADNSCGGQVWAGPNWGPLSNRLMHMSYGRCKLFSVLVEQYGDDVQGGVVRFPLDFQSGIMRARANPVDGQVYVVGMQGWQTNAVRTGCVQRVRYTGKPLNFPVEVKTANNGLTIKFSDPLDAETATDTSVWSCERFNVKYTAAYGSDEYSVEDGSKKAHDKVAIKSIKLDPDEKTLHVELESMKLCTNMVFRYKIQAKDGKKINGELDYTINFIPGTEQKSPGMFPPEPKKKEDPKKDDKKKDEVKKDDAKKPADAK